MITHLLKSKFLENPAIPCLPLLISYILAMLPLTLNYLFNCSTITFTLWIPVFLLWKFKTLPRKHIIFIFVFGALNSYFYNSYSESHISKVTNHKKVYVSLQATVTNVHYPNKILQWNVKTPQYIMKSEKIFIKNEHFLCNGLILINNLRENLEFGDSLELTGRLVPINQVADQFYQSPYYRQKKITHIFYPDKHQILKPASGLNSIKKYLYNLRDNILFKATTDLQNAKTRRIVASIFFGYKGLLTAKEKDIFQKSGTAHLFAVSGLHVGIAASFLFLLFKIMRIPNKHTPYFLLPLLFLYVFMTGSPPSAIRAFVMLTVWSIARSNILPSTGTNNLAVSALLILILNPLDLFSLGFLYTFIITTSLVLSYEKSLKFFQTLNEKNSWKGNFQNRIPFLYKAAMLLFCSMTASLASWGLNLLFNQQVIPLAFVTNFFTSLLAWLSFMTASLSTIGLPVFYTIQNGLIDTLLWLAESGAIYWNSRDISIILICAYYLGIFTCLSQKFTNPAIATLTAVLMIVISIPSQQNKLSIFLNSSSNTPTIGLQFEGKKYIINATSKTASRFFLNQKIDAIYFSESKANHSWALESFLEQTSPTLIQTSGRHTSYLKRKFPDHKVLINSHFEPTVKSSYDKRKNSYTYVFEEKPPGSAPLKITVVRELYGSCKVSIQIKDFNKEVTFTHQNFSQQLHVKLPNS